MSKFGILFGLMAVVLLSSSVVSAFGVAAEYWADRPLEISPGQTVNTYFMIQNVGDSTGDIDVKASVIEGAEFATLLDGSSYSVADGQQREARIEVSVPSDAPIGTIYPVKVLFQQVSSGNGNEPLQFSFNVEREFGVVVVESEAIQQISDKVESNNFWLWIIGLIVFVVLVWVVIVMFKKK